MEALSTSPELEDLMDDPHRFGLPTLEEYMKNPSRWKIKEDEVVDGIDAGDRNLGCTQEYYVEQYKMDSLEHATQTMRNMAGSVKAFKYDPQVIPAQQGIKLRITFRLKEEHVIQSPG